MSSFPYRLQYIDEDDRMQILKQAKKQIYWYTPKITEAEIEVLLEITVGSKQDIPIQINGEKIQKSFHEPKELIKEKIVDKTNAVANTQNLQIGVLMVDAEVIIYNVKTQPENNAAVNSLSFASYLQHTNDSSAEVAKFLKKSKKRNDAKSIELSDALLLHIQKKMKILRVSAPGIRLNQKRILFEELKQALDIEDETMLERFRPSWKVFSKSDAVKKISTNLEQKLMELKRQFMYKSEYGWILFRVNEEKWEKAKIHFEESVLKSSDEAFIEQALMQNKKMMENILSKIVLNNKNGLLGNTGLLEGYMDSITKKLVELSSSIAGIKLRVILYDVSFEILRDRNFCEIAAGQCAASDPELSEVLFALSERSIEQTHFLNKL